MPTAVYSMKGAKLPFSRVSLTVRSSTFSAPTSFQYWPRGPLYCGSWIVFTV